MRVQPQDALKFRQLVLTSNPALRAQLSQELGIPMQQVRAFEVPNSLLREAHGRAIDVGTHNQDGDFIRDGRDLHPFESDANQDMVTDGKDPRFDQERDVDHDGLINGKDPNPFTPDLS